MPIQEQIQFESFSSQCGLDLLILALSRNDKTSLSFVRRLYAKNTYR